MVQGCCFSCEDTSRAKSVARIGLPDEDGLSMLFAVLLPRGATVL